jgi:hypothetical protein
VEDQIEVMLPEETPVLRKGSSSIVFGKDRIYKMVAFGIKNPSQIFKDQDEKKQVIDNIFKMFKGSNFMKPELRE